MEKRKKIRSLWKIVLGVRHTEWFIMRKVGAMFHVQYFQCVSKKVFTDWVLLILRHLLFIQSVGYWGFGEGLVPVFNFLDAFVLELHWLDAVWVLVMEVFDGLSFHDQVTLFWKFSALDSLVINEFLNFLDFLRNILIYPAHPCKALFNMHWPTALNLLLWLRASWLYKTHDLRFLRLLFLS